MWFGKGSVKACSLSFMGARTLRQGGALAPPWKMRNFFFGCFEILKAAKKFGCFFSWIISLQRTLMVSKVGLTLSNFTQEFEKSGAFTAGTSFQLSSRRGGGKSYFFRRAKVTFPSKTYAIMTETQKMRGIFKIIQMQRGKCPTCRPIWRPFFTDINRRKILESRIRYSIYCFNIHWVYSYINAQTLLIFIIYYPKKSFL